MIRLPHLSSWNVVTDVFGNIRTEAYVQVEGLDHVKVQMDAEGEVIQVTAFVPSAQMWAVLTTKCFPPVKGGKGVPIQLGW